MSFDTSVNDFDFSAFINSPATQEATFPGDQLGAVDALGQVNAADTAALDVSSHQSAAAVGFDPAAPMPGMQQLPPTAGVDAAMDNTVVTGWATQPHGDVAQSHDSVTSAPCELPPTNGAESDVMLPLQSQLPPSPSDKAVNYSSRIADHHSRQLQSVLPALSGAQAPASAPGIRAAAAFLGRRSAGGSISSPSVPVSQSARRALHQPRVPPMTLQERRRNSRRAQAQAKSSVNASSHATTQSTLTGSGGSPGTHNATAGSGISTSGRSAKRGMTSTNGRIHSPSMTSVRRATTSSQMAASASAGDISNAQLGAQVPQVPQQHGIHPPLVQQQQQLLPQHAQVPHDARTRPSQQNPSALMKRGSMSRVESAQVPRQAYSATGFDLLGALARVVLRPNPRIMLGPVDMSCSFTVCDARHPEQPIVFCSDTFCKLTGYQRHEILGRNCRFLQSPDGRVEPGSERYHTDNAAVAHLKQHSHALQECQASLINYRKNGTPFINLVTIVPIPWGDSPDPVYLVGFQVDLVEQPTAVLERAEDGSYVVNYSTGGAGIPVPASAAEVVAPAITRDLEQEAANREVTIGKELTEIMANGKDDAGQWARILLQHSQDLIHVLSLKGTFLYVSPSVERLLGWKPEELIGKSVSDFCHPSDVVPVFRELKDSTSNASINAAAKRSFRNEGVANRATKGGVGQGGPEVNLLMRMRHKEGQYSWVESKGKLHLEQGKGRKVVISSGRTRPVYNLPWEPVRATVGDAQPSFWAKMSNDGLILSATEGAASVIDGVDSAALYGRHLTQMVNNEAMPALLEGLRGIDVCTVTHQMWNAVEDGVWVTSTLFPSAVMPGAHVIPTVFVRISLMTAASMDSSACRPNVVEHKQMPEAGIDATTASGAVPGSSVFGELSTGRSSSHIFELHSLKHANRRLKEEVRAAQRRVCARTGVQPALPLEPTSAALQKPTAPLKEGFVKALDRQQAARLAPPRHSSSSTPSGNGNSSTEPSSLEIGGGSTSEDTAPTTAISSGNVSDVSSGNDKPSKLSV